MTVTVLSRRELLEALLRQYQESGGAVREDLGRRIRRLRAERVAVPRVPERVRVQVLERVRAAAGERD